MWVSNDLIIFHIPRTGGEFRQHCCILGDVEGNKVNNSGNRKNEAIYTPELEKRVLEAEREVIERYYETINPADV